MLCYSIAKLILLIKNYLSRFNFVNPFLNQVIIPKDEAVRFQSPSVVNPLVPGKKRNIAMLKQITSNSSKIA